MLVSGGYNTETKVTMDDLAVFDFYAQTWCKLETYKMNGELFKPEAIFYNETMTKIDDQLLSTR